MKRWIAATLLALGPGCRPASDDTSLRFWGFGREGEVAAQLIRGFERENPDIRVRVQSIPWSAAHEKLLTAQVGRATPDVAQLGNTWIPELVTLKALEPLEPLRARSAAIRPPSYFPGIWATNYVDGTLYGIPWYVDTRVLFYRRDLLARAGYDSVPGDWDGWRTAMLAMKRNAGPREYPLLLPLNEWPPQVILGLQGGSELISPDGYARFSDPGFARGFEFMLDLFRDGLAPAVSGNEIANLYQEFSRGTIAMYITGPWNLGEFRRRLPPELQDAWDTTPLPGPSGPGSGVSLAGGSSLVIFRSSTKKAAAWRLIEYLSRPDVQAEFYRLTGDLPARVEAWEDSSLAGDQQARAFRVQLERVVPTPMIPEWENVTVKVMDWTERAVRGRVGAEPALRGLDAEVNQLLERRRWLLSRRPASAGATP
jgi:multiple sugar transport system substrate-binding protein